MFASVREANGEGLVDVCLGKAGVFIGVLICEETSAET